LNGYQVGFYYFEQGEDDPKVDSKVCEMHVSHETIAERQVSVGCMVEDEVVWYSIWLSQRRDREGSYRCTSQRADNLGMVSKAEL
jgi:hypothetical protein